MRPKQPEAPSDDLFRSSLEAIIDPSHELVQLSSLIDWDRFDDAFGTHYHDRKGRHGLPTRLMAGLHLLKHMKGFSDDETCAAWLENPYFQAFCGETHFQHRLPFDRSSLHSLMCIRPEFAVTPPPPSPPLRVWGLDAAAVSRRIGTRRLTCIKPLRSRLEYASDHNPLGRITWLLSRRRRSIRFHGRQRLQRPGKHRFRAANGAMITVAVDELLAQGSRERALEIAKEAIAQVAAAQSRERPAPARERKAGCGDLFWSWAAPEEFRR